MSIEKLRIEKLHARIEHLTENNAIHVQNLEDAIDEAEEELALVWAYVFALHEWDFWSPEHNEELTKTARAIDPYYKSRREAYDR